MEREDLARAWFYSRHPQYGMDGIDGANDWWKEESLRAADKMLKVLNRN